MYSQNIINRFTNPQNAGHMKNADGIGIVGNPNMGDVIKIYIRVEEEKITEAKFKAFGSVVAIAASDVVTDLVLNKSLENAKKISSTDVIRELGEIEPRNQSSISLTVEALYQAIEDYYDKQEKLRKKQEKLKLKKEKSSNKPKTEN